MPIIAIIATAVSELPVWLCQPLWSLAMPALFVTTLSACSVGYASHCAVFVVGYAGQLLLAMPITAKASVVCVGRYCPCNHCLAGFCCFSLCDVCVCHYCPCNHCLAPLAAVYASKHLKIPVAAASDASPCMVQ